jgi:hypothetical protein
MLGTQAKRPAAHTVGRSSFELKMPPTCVRRRESHLERSLHARSHRGIHRRPVRARSRLVREQWAQA